MKRKDLLALIVSGVLFTVVGIFLVNQFGSGPNRAEVENVQAITPEFDNEGIRLITGEGEIKIRDFTPPVNTKGVGNNNPFNGN